jgi:OmpA-OmpF porin, OOP family
MVKIKLLVIVLFFGVTTFAQTKKPIPAAKPANDVIPISNADLGKFPYFKTLPNFTPTNTSDSVTVEQNRTYFYNGNNFITIDGQVSAQSLNVIDDSKKIPSEFQIVQEFDKIVSTLGGKKIYTGSLPEDKLKTASGLDVVSLSSKKQLAPSAHYGVVEYAIKTPIKEVWVQLVPGTIGSKFYNLLVVEKQSLLLTTNINKANTILADVEKNGKAIFNLFFDVDAATLLTTSKDEVLNIVNIYQQHPNWKLQLEIHSAPIGKPEYSLALTEKRATAIKEELISLGVKAAQLDVKGMGDTKPIASNDTEKGRLDNTRVEIMKL